MLTSGSETKRRRKPEVHVAPDAISLPWHRKKAGSPRLGKVLLAAATADGAAALILLVLSFGGVTPGLHVVGIILGVSAVLMALFAVNQIRSLDEWEFTPTEVRRHRQMLLGSQNWTEPLSDYQGVLAREEYHSGGKNQASYTLYICELKHESNKKRNVRLYSSRSQEGFRSRQEHYGRLFDMPILIQTATGIEERRAEDLGKSVRERVAEGSLKAEFDPGQMPENSRLMVKVEGDHMLVTTRGGIPGAKVVTFLFLLVGAGLAAWGVFFRTGLGRIPLVLFGVLFVLLGVAGAFVMRTLRQELELSPEGVTVRWRLPWGVHAQETLPADEIRDVVVQKTSGGQGTPMVQLVGDDKAASFGLGLRMEDKIWVRDCVIAVISR